jgi:phosphatidylinositol alpha-1,6-mannosyltransferase
LTSLLVTEVFPPLVGGSGRWYWEVYRRLPRESYAIAAGQHPEQEAFDRTHDLRVHRLPLRFTSWALLSLKGLRGYWRAYRGLGRVVKGEGVRRLHCGRCLPEGWAAWLLRRRLGVPYLCFAHGEELNIAATSRELTGMMRRVMAEADCLVANSRNTERILRDEWGMAAERIRLLHPGVDTGRFRPAPPDEAVRRRLGWDGRRVILTVGRLQKRKGHDHMILALGAVRRALPDVLYAVVGEGEERQALEELVRRGGLEGHVQFLGQRDDAEMVQCYQQCDLFVLPNRQVGEDIEGFGMVLLEAQACGRPVLAGASGGTAETMRAPQTGRVVPCDGPEELTLALTRLLAQPGLLDRMGAAGRDWVVERFDWAALARQAERLFAGEVAPAAPAADALTAEAVA